MEINSLSNISIVLSESILYYMIFVLTNWKINYVNEQQEEGFGN